MKRSIIPSIIAGIFLTIPLAIYQNFLAPAEINRPSITSDKTQILSPLPDQVVSMLEDSILVWLDSSESYSGKIKITDDWGTVLLESVVQVEAGESEHYLEVNQAVRETRNSWLHAEVYSGDELIVRQRFGWGLIFLTAGQSNTGNWQCSKCTSTPAPLNHVVFLSGSSGEFTFVPATATSPLTDGNAQNVWYYLGEKIWNKSKIPVAFINVGESGTNLSQWLNQLFSRLEYGKYFKVSALLWHQGESDYKITREDYRASLLDLVEQTRREFQYEVPWYIARTSRCGQTSSQEIIAAQNDVITGMGLTDVFTGPDTDSINHLCHFDTQEELDQYADSWYYELKNSSLLGKILN